MLLMHRNLEMVDVVTTLILMPILQVSMPLFTMSLFIDNSLN